jgi:ankyrin repeat protein
MQCELTRRRVYLLRRAVKNENYAVVARFADLLDIRNAAGITPFLLVIRSGSLAMARHMLKLGADPNTALPDGETALHVAARHRKPQFTALLVAFGADPFAANAGGALPLHVAAYGDRAAVVALYVTHGMPADTLDRRGRTALMAAITNNALRAAVVLLENGADGGARDGDGFGLDVYETRCRYPLVRIN